MKKEQIIEEIKNRIKEIQWFRQAAAIKPLYLLIPAVGAGRGISSTTITSVKGMNCEFFVPKKIMIKQAETALEANIENTNMIDRYMKDFYAANEQLDNFFKKIDLEKNLFNQLNEFNKILLDVWSKNWLCDKFDPEGNEMLAKEIGQIKLNSEEIFTLTFPQKLNYIDEEELELNQIALSVYDEKLTDEELIEELKQHAQKFFYINNSWYNVEVLQAKDFLDGLKKLLSYDQKLLIKRVDEINNKINSLKDKCNQIVKDKNISPNLNNTFYLFRRLAESRDVRKMFTLKTNHYWDVFAKAFAKRYSYNYNEIVKASPYELNEENLSSKEYMDELKRRKDHTFFYITDKNIFVYSDKQAEKLTNLIQNNFLEEFEELKGRCASKGKVIGTVKVVMNEVHFSKFNEGDILVAPMTRPEYILLMKKASAIITDEGGLTCHATIISRELGIPCIIGTQVASKKLIDGMEVEVDADNSIIKVIK